MCRTVVFLLVVLAGCSKSHPFAVAEAGGPVLFKKAVVFDAPNARAFDGLLDVLVTDGKIAAVGPEVTAPAGARVVEGGFVMPGLIDLHVHVGGGSAPPWHRELPDAHENLQAFLYAGVTTVLDTAAITPGIFELREKVRRGDVLGPHLYAAGPCFTAPGGHPAAMVREIAPWPIHAYITDRMTREVASPKEATDAVNELAKLKPDVVKMAVDAIPTDAPVLQAQVARAIAEAAHAQGLRAVAHIGNSQSVEVAVAAGVDALVHGVYPEPISETALAALAKAKIPVVFTASVFDSIERVGLAAPPEFNALEKDICPAPLRAEMHRPPHEFERQRFEPWIRSVIDGHQARRDNIRKMRAAGITVLAGSDSPNVCHIPGASLHQELDVLVESGMSAGEALRAATFENARFLLGERADVGEVAVGKRADLVWLKENPLVVAGGMHNVGLVVLDGRVLKRQPRPQ